MGVRVSIGLAVSMGGEIVVIATMSWVVMIMTFVFLAFRCSSSAFLSPLSVSAFSCPLICAFLVPFG